MCYKGVLLLVIRISMGPIGCPEKSVRNYHYSLRNNPEEGSSQLLRGGSLKSHVTLHSLLICRSVVLDCFRMSVII